jgi:drug/metabolite transporter (DMT)-like permease
MKSSYSDFEAVGFSLTAFTAWVLADSTIKLVGHSNLPASEVVGFLGFFMVVFLLLHGLWRNKVSLLWPIWPKRQFVRSCLDLINCLCVVVAIRHLPLTLFYILVFMSPMVTAILAAWFLHEHLDWRKSLAIVAGFAGVVVAVDPFGSARQGDWIGFAACMVCVCCFSVNMVWSRTMTQTEKPESLVFFSGLLMAAYGFGCMIWQVEPVTIRLTAAFVAMGFFCTVGNICFFVALKHTSAANVSQYHYTQLITGALIAYLFWHEVPTISMLAGGILIVGSGLYIAVEAAQKRVDAGSISPLVDEQTQ